MSLEDTLVRQWWQVVKEAEHLREELQKLGYLPRIEQGYPGAVIKGSLTKNIPEPGLENKS